MHVGYDTPKLLDQYRQYKTLLWSTEVIHITTVSFQLPFKSGTWGVQLLGWIPHACLYRLITAKFGIVTHVEDRFLGVSHAAQTKRFVGRRAWLTKKSTNIFSIVHARTSRFKNSLILYGLDICSSNFECMLCIWFVFIQPRGCNIPIR